MIELIVKSTKSPKKCDVTLSAVARFNRTSIGTIKKIKYSEHKMSIALDAKSFHERGFTANTNNNKHKQIVRRISKLINTSYYPQSTLLHEIQSTARTKNLLI